MSEAQAEITESTLQSRDGTDQYLTFMLAGEEYGLEILKVQEIKGWSSVTPMPNMPDFILGVINLRGTVVPIIDLRKRFSMESIPYSQTTVVIVVKVVDEAGAVRTMGIVVDGVSEVHNVARDDLKPAPEFGGTLGNDSIKGLVTQDERMLIILDIDHLMNNGVLDQLEQAED
jgi:purine-binding chemotaxis protein CheW